MSRHLSFLLLASLIVLEVDMITSIMIPSVSCLYVRCLMVSPSSLRGAQFSGGSMIKRENRIQEIKREELPWMRLKRGPDEVDEVIDKMLEAKNGVNIYLGGCLPTVCVN